MAREPMVTRTVKATRCNVLCLDTQSVEPFNQSITIPRTYTKEEKMMEAIKKQITDEHIKPVQIVESVVFETLYGMPESEFIQIAKELPPRKKTETEEAVTEENEI